MVCVRFVISSVIVVLLAVGIVALLVRGVLLML
jgi:hypothetical protein